MAVQIQVVRGKGRFSGWDGIQRHVVRGKGRFSGWDGIQRHVVREKGRFSGWDGSPETSRPGKGPVSRMGWQSGDKLSGKLDVFPDEISLVIVILPQVCPSRGGKPGMRTGYL